MKLVGQATEVRFDIGKGHFKMTVSVGWDDRIPCSPSSSTTKGKTSVNVDPENDEGLATEVYIPLVHYAHPKLLKDATDTIASVGSSAGERGRMRGRMPRPTQDVEPLSMSFLTTATGTTTASSDSETDAPRSLQSRSTAVNGRSICGHVERSVSMPSVRAPLLIRDCTPDLVDVEVKVSGGRFVVRGQTLFWWYDVPTGECEPRREYTLEVKRRGGVLKPPIKGRRVGSEEGCGGWCEQLCSEDGPSGCVVA